MQDFMQEHKHNEMCALEYPEYFLVRPSRALVVKAGPCWELVKPFYYRNSRSWKSQHKLKQWTNPTPV